MKRRVISSLGATETGIFRRGWVENPMITGYGFCGRGGHWSQEKEIDLLDGDLRQSSKAESFAMAD